MDVAAIDTLVGITQGDVRTGKAEPDGGINTEIYAGEYKRINSEMDDLQDKRSVVTRAEITRRETLERVWEIDKALRGMGKVAEFDEGLFGMLVERIKVMNLVQVEFVLRAGVGVVEII